MSGFYDGPEISFDSGKSGSSSGPVKFIVGYVIFEVIKSGVREVISERRVRKAKKESFQDGLKEGKNLTVKEIKKFADFWFASAALLTYAAYCDGEISDEERLEIEYDLGSFFKNKDVPDEIREKFMSILANHEITFEEVKGYLDCVSMETLKAFETDVEEVINASGGVNKDEQRVRDEFKEYLEERKKSEKQQ